MAFTGTASVVQVSDRQVRITGLSLDGGASGTIGLNGATGTAPGVTLPAAFKPGVYDYGAANVALASSIRLDWDYVDTAGQLIFLTVAKTGTTVADFRITVTNNSGSASSGVEMYVFFHD
jgi:hypothetical protein